MNLPREVVTLMEQQKLNFQIQEVAIPVPWGYVVGKWLGRRDCRPILAIHGYQGNAGTFDRLIPLLPKHIGYLAIDLPGHGLSSHLPPGMFYSTLHFAYVIHLIVNYFKWDKVSFLAHSFGGIVTCYYAGIFPERCDMIIAVDTLKPIVFNRDVVAAHLRINTEGAAIADQHIRNGTEPPAYDFETLLDKIKVNLSSEPLCRVAALYLLQRGIKPSTLYANRWYFSRDQRLKSYNLSSTSQEVAMELVKSIKAPVFYLKTEDLMFPTEEGHILEALNILRTRNTLKLLQSDKSHYLHLTDPEFVQESVSEFILKCRPLDENLSAKL